MSPMAFVIIAYLGVNWGDGGSVVPPSTPPMQTVLYSLVEDRKLAAKMQVLPPAGSTLDQWFDLGWRLDGEDAIVQSLHHTNVLIRVVHEAPPPGSGSGGFK